MRTSFRTVCALTAAAALLLCLQAYAGDGRDDHRASAPGKISFTDVTFAAGVAGNPDDGGHGVAFADVDNDGDLDIFVTNTVGDGFLRPNYLYINQGNGKFKNEAAKRGVEGEDLGSHGVVFADLDNDGDLDLLVGNAGAGSPAQNRVYINDGAGYFADRTRNARLFGKQYFTRGIAPGDFDGDGKVDFVITNPVGPDNYRPDDPVAINRFFQNRGKNRFTLIPSGLLYSGLAQGITVADIDNDGDLDLIETIQGRSYPAGISNSLWLNNGSGQFSEAGQDLGDNFHKDGNNYNGAAVGDTDNDGDLDIVVLGDRLRFFRNDGNGDFTVITESSGLEGQGFTACFGDIDLDGRLDVIVTNDAQGSQVFQNTGGNRFRRIGDSGIYPPVINDPRGMALGDYDGDGDLDLVVIHKRNHIQLFRNNTNKPKFVKLRLTAPSGELGAIGAKVWVYKSGNVGEPDSLLAYREVGSSTGYVSQNAPEVHVGLRKKKQKVDILIKFLDDSTAQFNKIKPGRTITVDFK